MNFSLDQRLQNDCIVVGRLELCQLLLMNNSALPWFILVPQRPQTEIIDLPVAAQQLLWAEVAQVAEFVRSAFQIDKLNVGAIGNVVSQLHVHVVGRRHTDYCWPDVVWGQPVPAHYTPEELAEMLPKVTGALSLEAAE